MADKKHITYLFDPLCGWCYGASGALEKLAARTEIELELAPTGLFAGDGAREMDDAFATFAWSNDERIARLSGEVFSQSYRHDVLGDRTRLFDSGPATMALTAVYLVAADRELEALKAIQKARYVDGRDITDGNTLKDVLRSLDLEAAADLLDAPASTLIVANSKRVEAARGKMRQIGASGVPALVAGTGDKIRAIQSSALFGDINLLVDQLSTA